MHEKLQKILDHLDITFKRQQEERKQSAIEAPVATTTTEQLKPDAEKQELQISNQRLRTGLIAASVISASMIWWAFDHLFSVPLLSQQPNYYLLKVVGQLLLITLTFALFFKTYRATWISTTVALTICFIMLCKPDTKQDKQEPAKQEIKQTAKNDLLLQ
ncbi:MAG: hypothetical protein IPK46_10810 [Saprospiraceae bacterium]|nr:hypothetical protein [Saprospiraceae bacterium]